MATGIKISSGVSVNGVGATCAYFDGVSQYYQSAGGQWFKLVAGAWSVTLDPTVVAPPPPLFVESADATTVVGTSGAITDSKGAKWTINTAQQIVRQVVLNSTPAIMANTALVAELYYHNHVVYQTSPNASALSTPGWWSWSDSTNSWTAALSPISGGGGTVGTGPTANGSLATADFGVSFGLPVSKYLWGVSTGGAGDNSFAAFANSGQRTAFATVNPPLWRFNGDQPTNQGNYWNSDLTINAGRFANLLANFPTVNPTGDAGIIFGANINTFYATTPSVYAKAMGDLARYFKSAKMANGQPLPVIGYETHNEPDGNVDPTTLGQFYSAAYAAIKAVDPNLYMLGPVTSWVQGGYAQSMLAASAHGFDVYCWHAYLGGNDPGNAAMATTRATDDIAAVNAVFAAGKPVFLGEYNIDYNCSAASQHSYVGAVFAAKMAVDLLNGAKGPAWAGIWDATTDGTCGITSGTGQVYPNGAFLARARKAIFGPRVVCNNPSSCRTVAVQYAPGRVALMIVHDGSSGSQIGSVAFSHWPGNANGSGSVTLWQLSSANPNGSTSTVTFTNGVSTSITIPAGSITILAA